MSFTTAEERGASLIVVGTTHRGALAGSFREPCWSPRPAPHDALSAAVAAGGWAGLATTGEGIEHERRRMQDAIDDALRSIPDTIQATGEVAVSGDTASAIVTLSEAADLLLIGSRGYGPLKRVLLGTVASAVLREAACPVIVPLRSSVACS